MGVHELAQGGDRGEEQVLAARGDEAEVDVGGEVAAPLVRHDADTVGYRADAARDVGDDDEVVHLRPERRQERLQLARVAVGDDDRRDGWGQVLHCRTGAEAAMQDLTPSASR
jgi:hypothetical protein